MSGLRPSARVGNALRRISRDRWLMPQAVADVGLRLARCASPRCPNQVLMHAVPECAMHVGLVCGDPPAWPGESKYKLVLKIVRDQSRDEIKSLIQLLQLEKIG